MWGPMAFPNRLMSVPHWPLSLENDPVSLFLFVKGEVVFVLESLPCTRSSVTSEQNGSLEDLIHPTERVP